MGKEITRGNFNNQLALHLIKHPDSMVFVLQNGPDTKIMPFKCRKFSEDAISGHFSQTFFAYSRTL